jgi:hypothetical protein
VRKARLAANCAPQTQVRGASAEAASAELAAARLDRAILRGSKVSDQDDWAE